VTGWIPHFIHNSAIFSSKNLVGKGILATFAAESRNSITNQIKIVARKNEQNDKENSQLPSGLMIK